MEYVLAGYLFARNTSQGVPLRVRSKTFNFVVQFRSSNISLLLFCSWNTGMTIGVASLAKTAKVRFWKQIIVQMIDL